MAITYLRLFPATTQFVLKNGALNTAGLLRVYLEGTDDLAPVFDTDGAQLQQPVILDNDGRAPGLFVDSSKVYRLQVNDSGDGQIYTVRKMVPSGGGAGSALGNTFQVISSDGTVNVTEFVNAGMTTFDLSCDIDPEASKWGSAMSMRASLDGDDTWAEVPIIATTGSMTYQNGWAATKDCLGDIAASIAMTGSATATHTIDTKLVVTVDGTEVYSEQGLLDPSESCGLVSFSWKGELAESQKVDARIYVKTTESMSVGLVGRVFYNEECDGVVGGEGAVYIPGTGIDISGDVISVTGMQPVSAMSSYVQTSGITGLMPMSGMSAYVEQTAFDACCSAMSSHVSSLENSASSLESGLTSLGTALTGIQQDTGAISAAVSGLTGTYVQYADLESASGKITGISGTALWGGHEYSGVWPIVVDNTAEKISAANKTLAVDETMTGYASGDSAVIGVNTSTVLSGLTAYQPTSAMTAYQPSGDYAYNSSLADYQPTSAMTAYQPSGNYLVPDDITGKADSSALTAYQPTSAMTAYQPSGDYYSASNPSGFITGVDLSDYATTAYVDSSVSSKADSSSLSAYALSADVSAWSSQINDLSAIVSGIGEPYDLMSGPGIALSSDSAAKETTIWVSADYAENSAVSSKADQSSLTAYQEITGMSAYQLTADMTGYQPSGDYYSATNPSGFITGVDLSDYATTAYVDSSVSGKLDTTAFNSGDFYSTSNPSGFITGVDLSDYATTGYVDSSVSGKLDASASGDFYSTSNPSGFITGVDLSNYATTGYVDSSVSGKQDSSAMTAYQEITGMSAYQPSGDYIYVSALGWAEV